MTLKIDMQDVVLARRALASVEQTLRDKKQKTSHLKPLWEAWLICFEHCAGGETVLSINPDPNGALLALSKLVSNIRSTPVRQPGILSSRSHRPRYSWEDSSVSFYEGD